MVRFEEGRVLEFVRAKGKIYVRTILHRGDGWLVLRRYGRPETWRLSRVDKGLRIEDRDHKVRDFERLAEVPPELVLAPIPLGEARSLPPERVEAVAAELVRRFERDQEARESDAPVLSPERQVRMLEVDADNRRYLLELLREVGWIDIGRFGKKASTAALVMIKHHEDPAIQMAVLPFVEKDFVPSGGAPELFAIFFDGLRMTLGETQRFGSQAGRDATGNPCVLPLEDPDWVEARRREIGLPPLSEYLAQRSEIWGTPVRLQCAEPPLPEP